MQTFKDYSSGSKDLSPERKAEVEGLISDLTKTAEKHFPNGFINVHLWRSLGVESIVMEFGLIKNTSELASKIRMNDPVHHRFMISIRKDGYQAEILMGGISTNPEAGSYKAMNTIKTPFRKTTGDAKKIVSTFDTFFGRLKSLVKEHKDNIYNAKNYDERYFK